MGLLLANNAATTVPGALSSTATSLTVASGTGTQFPILGTGDFFYATIQSIANAFEVVKVTARADDTMTIVRGQEGTLAIPFSANSRFELRVTVKNITDLPFQPLDATLTALAGLATGVDKLPYSTGSDTFAQADFTAFARTLLDDADATAARTTLSAQTLDATLTALAGLATGADKVPYSTGTDTFAQADFTAFARTLLDDANAAAARATLGVQDFADTFAAARLLSPVDGQLVQILGRSAAADYGGGLYRAAVSAAADNDGTILVTANSLRLIFTGEYCTPEQWGATIGTGGSCTAAYNAWAAEAVAGRAPRWYHHAQRAVYRYVTAPAAITDGNQFRITGTGIGTSIFKGFTSSAESGGVFKFVGGNNVTISGFASRCSDNTEGGSIIRLEADAGSGGGHSFISDVYMTFENSPAQSITGATAANPAVFTCVAHGYSNGNRVVATFQSADINWLNLNYREWTISDAAANTFTLTEFGTATKLNTTGYGALTGGTIARCRAPHAHISIDGQAKTTGATGVRGVYVSDCQIFGGGQGGAIHATSCVGLYCSNVSTSGAGLNGAIVVDGTAGVPSYYVAVAGGQLDGFREDRAILTMVAAVNQGSHLRTANTQDSTALGKVSGFSGHIGTRNSARDYIPLSGGRALQRKKITGVTASYATFTWPFAFKSTPDAVWAVPFACPSTASVAAINAPTTTGVDVIGQNLSGTGQVEIYAIGEMA